MIALSLSRLAYFLEYGVKGKSTNQINIFLRMQVLYISSGNYDLV